MIFLNSAILCCICVEILILNLFNNNNKVNNSSKLGYQRFRIYSNSSRGDYLFRGLFSPKIFCQFLRK